ncbi:MAG TPA: hypothetical protein VJ505_04365 [Holophagaceae bacterium]|nr:hypothetical protein [Holophagaceae bacterium]HJW32581.1 hypothetical protein [Holophagaceae bacterium]
MLPLACTLFLTQTPIPDIKPKVPEAMVVVAERSLVLPPLPKGVAEGRKGFASVHAQIKYAQEELSTSLQRLYATPEASRALAKDLEVPEASRGEVAGWLDVLKDVQFARLEGGFAEVWKGWQAALVEGGLAKPTRSPSGQPESHGAGYEAAKQKAKQVISAASRQPLRSSGKLDSSYNVENADLFGGGTEGMTKDERAGQQHVERSLYLAQTNRAIADILIPMLAESWDPLVDHLGGRARRLADLEAGAAPVADPILSALRTRAKIAFLERFRVALWYCDLVWSQSASVEAPAPPRRLAPSARR